MFRSDPSLDFHNKVIASVALGEQCPNKDKSSAYILTSPLGHVFTNACPDGLHCVRLYGDTDYDNIDWDVKVDYIRASSLLGNNKNVNQLKKWLQMYFDNAPKCVDIELSFCCLEKYGEFNSSVWIALRDTCPPGELVSYGELAQRIGMKLGASKVVGWAINKNPFSLVVGDHRVVKATGEIMTCDDSQRNKLRRLLIEHEISFTSGDVELELLKVKQRQSSVSLDSKPRKPRAKAKAKTDGVKGKTKASRRRKRQSSDSSDSDPQKSRARPKAKVDGAKGTNKKTRASRRLKRQTSSDESDAESS